MGQIKRNIPANSDQSVAAQGNVVYIVTASAGFTLEIGSDRFDVQQGDKLQVAGGYTSLRLINPAATAVDVELVATTGDFHRSQIASAVEIKSSVPIPVNVAAQTLSNNPELRQGKSFVGDLSSNTNNYVAGDVFLVALSNPANSGIMLIDPEIELMYGGPASGITNNLVRFTTDPLATISGLLKTPSQGSAVNKNQMLATTHPSTGQVVGGSIASDYNTAGGTISFKLPTINKDVSTEPVQINYSHGGIIIGPGQTMLVEALGVQNYGPANAQLEWVEQPVA